MVRPASKPPVYGEPEKRDWIKLAALWLAVLAGVALIGWMVSVSKPAPKMVCDESAGASLTKFGTCHDLK